MQRIASTIDSSSAGSPPRNPARSGEARLSRTLSAASPPEAGAAGGRRAKMVRKLRPYPLLAGFRGGEPADEESIVEAILCISRLSLDFPQIVELDINPVMVLPKGRGLRAIDCRMSIAEA